MSSFSSFGNRIRSGYLISFLLLVVSYFLIFYMQQRMVTTAASMVSRHAVIDHSESVKTECINAETAARGYVITKDVRFLEPYDEARRKIPGLFSSLKGFVQGDSEQAKNVDKLQQLVTRRLDSIASGLALFKANNMVVVTDSKRREESLATMDSMRLLANKVRGEETKRMLREQQRLSSLMKASKAIAIVSLGIVFAALIYSVITFNRENKRRTTADTMANTYKMDLESNKTELEEKNMELKQLKDVEKFTSTGRIARTIAHEVRNPLTNILLATEQLQELESKSPEAQQLLQLINRNATRINQLVSELLDATRFVNLKFEKVDLNLLLEETLEMARDRIKLHGVTVEKSYYIDICDVTVDREKIKVAFLNIIVNALEAMESGKGVLQIRTRQHGDKCVIEVRDNGKGMDDETLQKLFEPYFTNKPKGNGLGLTNTQNIILNHNGTISVVSKPGDGALFIVALDLARG